MRCNPSYRGSSWFDWVTVDYKRGESTYSVPARVYLWMTWKTSNQTASLHIFGLTQSLTSWKTPSFSFLPCFGCENLHDEAKVVNFTTSIKSTAFVLPENNETTAQELEENVEGNRTYVVIPPLNEWHRIGWDRDLDDEIKLNFNPLGEVAM